MDKKYLHLQDEALKILHDKGIFTVATSINLEDYEKTLDLAKKSPNILPTFGLFAHYALEYKPEIHNPVMEKSRILSEIGLTSMNMDPNLDYKKMEDVFRILLEHAEKAEKIVICHTSSEDEKALDILDKYSLPGVVIHGFRASHDLLQKIIDKGYYVSVGAMILDLFKERKNWNQSRSIAAEIPLDLLLTETDGPAPSIGLTTETIIQVVDTVAELKHESHQEIKSTVFSNFRKLIGRDIGLCKFSEVLSRT